MAEQLVMPFVESKESNRTLAFLLSKKVQVHPDMFETKRARDYALWLRVLVAKYPQKALREGVGPWLPKMLPETAEHLLYCEWEDGDYGIYFEPNYYHEHRKYLQEGLAKVQRALVRQGYRWQWRNLYLCGAEDAKPIKVLTWHRR